MIALLLLISLLCLHLFLLKNMQFTAWPEMLSYPYLLNNDFKLYQDIALPYQPVLISILSVFYKFFGYSVFHLQIFTWSIILLNDILVFLIVKKLSNNRAALVATLFYSSFQTFSDGNTLWFDLAATPFILAGLTLFFYAKGIFKYFVLGIFLSLASLTKQQVALTVIMVIIFLSFLKDLKKILFFLLGVAIPGFVVLFYVLNNGIFGSYIFWTFEVPLIWYPKAPGYVHLPSNSEWSKVVMMFSPVLLSVLVFKKWTKEITLLFLILLATFATSFPRFEFFRMQPTIALIALFAGVIVNWSKYYLWLVLVIITIYLGSVLPNHINQEGGVRFFSEYDFQIAELIKSKSFNEKKVYLLGLPSSQYIYAEKLTSMPWVDNYTWYMEIPGIQEKVIEGLKKEEVKYIFWKDPQQGQWFELGSYQPKTIVDYINNNYTYQESFGDIKLWKKKE